MGTSNYVSVLEDEYVGHSKGMFEEDNGYDAEGFDEDLIRKGLEVVKQLVTIPTNATFFFYPDVENNRFWLEWRYDKSKEGIMLIVRPDNLTVHRSDKERVVGEAWKVYETLQEVVADEYIYAAFLELGAKESAA